MLGVSLALEVSLEVNLNLETRTELERVVSWGGRIMNCEITNHLPYRQHVMIPYRPGRETVLMSCDNCHMLYERPPTRKERRGYDKIMELEITV